MWPNPQFSTDLVTITEEILNGKLYFLCSEIWNRRFVNGNLESFYQRISWDFDLAILVLKVIMYICNQYYNTAV